MEFCEILPTFDIKEGYAPQAHDAPYEDEDDEGCASPQAH